MRCKVAETLDIDKDNISIKATTTEGLGLQEKKRYFMPLATIKKIIKT